MPEDMHDRRDEEGAPLETNEMLEYLHNDLFWRYSELEAYFLDEAGLQGRARGFRAEMSEAMLHMRREDNPEKKLRILRDRRRLRELIEHIRGCERRLCDNPQRAASLRMQNGDLMGIIQVARNTVLDRLMNHVSHEVSLLLDVTQRFLLSREGKEVAQDILSSFDEDLNDLPKTWPDDIHIQASKWLERYKAVFLRAPSS